MQTETLAHDQPLPSVLDRFPAPAMEPRTAVAWRKRAFRSALGIAVPAAYAAGRAAGSRGTGILAGGLTLLGLSALRWQLARWFTETPAYETLDTVGPLELRRYPFRIEARTEVDVPDLATALDVAYARLECFLFGANTTRERVACVTPSLTTMRDGVHVISFLMPPRRDLASLPRPDDMRISLREVPEHRVAVHPFPGRITHTNVVWKERKLLRALVDAGLVAKGSVTLATYDAPATLPALRKSELWIEVV